MGDKHELPWAPIKRLIKSMGAEIVSEEAVKYLGEYLEERTKDIAESAILIMKKGGRKTLYKDDIKLSIRLSNK